MSTVRTQAGRRLLGYVVRIEDEFGHEWDVTPSNAVLAIEAEARRDAFAAIETAVTERMHGGVWLSEAAVLDIVKNAREESS